MADSETRRQTLRAKLRRFESRADFVQGYGPFIRRDGFLLRSRNLRDPGTRLSFQLALADGSPVFAGDGIVREHRSVGSEEQKSAMFIAYERLDEPSRSIVDDVIDARRAKRLKSRQDMKSGPHAHVASGTFRAVTSPPSAADDEAVGGVADELASSLDSIFGDIGGPKRDAESGASPQPPPHRKSPATGTESTLMGLRAADPADPGKASPTSSRDMPSEETDVEAATRPGTPTVEPDGTGETSQQSGTVGFAAADRQELATRIRALTGAHGSVSTGEDPSGPPASEAGATDTKEDARGTARNEGVHSTSTSGTDKSLRDTDEMPAVREHAPTRENESVASETESGSFWARLFGKKDE